MRSLYGQPAVMLDVLNARSPSRYKTFIFLFCFFLITLFQDALIDWRNLCTRPFQLQYEINSNVGLISLTKFYEDQFFHFLVMYLDQKAS